MAEPAKSGEKLEEISPGNYIFDCPGCGVGHWFRTSGASGAGPVWQLTGGLKRPSVTPSILVNGRKPEKRCHFYITEGQIRYQNDCWHALKGQTVDMADVE